MKSLNQKEQKLTLLIPSEKCLKKQRTVFFTLGNNSSINKPIKHKPTITFIKNEKKRIENPNNKKSLYSI